MKNLEMEKKIKEFILENTLYEDIYWFPLNKLKSDISVVVYDLDKIYKENKADFLLQVFDEMKLQNVNSYHMEQHEYFENQNVEKLIFEKDEDGFCFPWKVEVYYFDESESWMVYVSHEGTITFTGKEIAQLANKIIPKDYFY